MVENKVIKKITNQDKAQLINYLKTILLSVGIEDNSVEIRGNILYL